MVDVEWADADPGLRRRDAGAVEDDVVAAAPGSVHQLGLEIGAVDERRGGPQLADDPQLLVHDVDDPDVGRAAQVEHLGQQTADRTGTEQQDAIPGHDPEPLDAPDHAGEWLGEGGLLERLVVLDPEQVPDWDADVIGKRAGRRVADGAPVVAAVRLSAEAVVAVVAVEGRIHGDPVALLPAVDPVTEVDAGRGSGRHDDLDRPVLLVESLVERHDCLVEWDAIADHRFDRVLAGRHQRHRGRVGIGVPEHAVDR